MDRLARAFVSLLLLAAATLSVGCGISSEGAFSPDKFWEDRGKYPGPEGGGG
jgi:hypothetical protein